MGVSKKGGGGKLARTQVVTVRLDPKLRFAAELVARKQRRTLSSMIEWTIEAAIDSVMITEDIALSQVVAQAWNAEATVRFIRLALY